MRPEGVTAVWNLRDRVWRSVLRLGSEERGATAIEYALMVSLIAVVVIAAVAILGTTTSSQFDKVQFSTP